MKDAYLSAFYDVVKDTQKTTGFELPEHLEAYVVMLLASFTDRTHFLPEYSFAETYIRLINLKSPNIKELGDTCLFVSGVFPKYKTRYGLNVEYFSSIGSNSYLQVAETMNADLFIDLSNRFNYVREFISITVNSTNNTGLTDWI